MLKFFNELKVPVCLNSRSFLLNHYSIHEIMSFYHHKYPNCSEYQALISLTYFEDAESNPMPVMLIDDDWDQMKRTIFQAAKDYQAYYMIITN